MALCYTTAIAQHSIVELGRNQPWQFRQQDSGAWMPATVPGTVHTDLQRAGRIGDPFYRDNEAKLQWIGRRNWEYRTTFDAATQLRSLKNAELVFDGLDTYADVYFNGKLVLQANNMFRQWRVNVKSLLQPKNELLVLFRSAHNIVDSMAKANLPLMIPDNPRTYARKAQYHFGWDWGPTFVTCGIWQPVRLEGYNTKTEVAKPMPKRKVELVQQADSVGRSFYFAIDGKPVYMKGANYIPSHSFLPELTKEDYRKIIKSAKDANMNMLRVWGGGIYEPDWFYDLCDEYGIYVWQDFMFAGAMVPTDEHFIDNVREEVKYQVNRLKHHPSIILWCGNNEVDEAWHNWGWQKQYNLRGEDSAKVWNAYKRLFKDSLPMWVNRWDGTRPYVSTSPTNGWGRPQSFTEGDSHYWGVWWGMQDIEVFEQKTGRFVSEYGMQGMPNMNTVECFTQADDRYLFSDVLKVHQKHPTGYQNIQGYLHRYFVDSNIVKALSLEDYTYLTQCLQHYCFKNMIAIHRSKYPVNMGTLLWQLNDCWPVCSWSITDYSRQPKAAWYGVREAYRDDVPVRRDSIRPKDLLLQKPDIKVTPLGNNRIKICSNVYTKYVYVQLPNAKLVLSDNYFDLQPGQSKILQVKEGALSEKEMKAIKIKTLYDIMSKLK
jgi:beta-mannosidase